LSQKGQRLVVVHPSPPESFQTVQSSLARIAAQAQPRSVFDKRRNAIFKGLSFRVAWIDGGIGVCGGSLPHLWFTLFEHRRRRRVILLILVTPLRHLSRLSFLLVP